jgi:hypothetical protein
MSRKRQKALANTDKLMQEWRYDVGNLDVVASQLTRTRTVAAAGVVLVLALAWMLARAVGGPDTRVTTGVVGIVNAFQSSVCIIEDGSGEQWCGPLAVSGDPIAAGQRVTMVISTLQSKDYPALEFGTVVPPKYQVTP